MIQIGDRVRVKTYQELVEFNVPDENGYIYFKDVVFVPSMIRMCGKEYTVQSVGDDFFTVEEEIWDLTEEMVEKL